MQMNREQLLLPRYELIADYPGNLQPIGTIFQHGLDCDGSIRLPDKQMDKYPHLFRRVDWWEHRTLLEMPNYVRWIDNNNGSVGNTRKVTCWVIYKNKMTCDLFPTYVYPCHLLPATEEEYNQFINK